MSRPAATPRQKPEPVIRRARFAEEDLLNTFGEAMLAEARRLRGAGAVVLAAAAPAIEATIAADGEHRRVVLTSRDSGRETVESLRVPAKAMPEADGYPSDQLSGAEL